jgi:uncharacterized protein YdbL (DUF1318 family)
MAANYAFAAVDATTTASQGAQLASGTATSAQIASIQNAAVTEGTTGFLTALNGSDAQSQNMLTYGILLGRNQSLQALADKTAVENAKISTNGAKDTYSRQGEINEWQAQNKLDTLFFLQTLFIFFTFVVVLLYFRKAGTLPSSSFYIFLGIALLIVIGILWNRASYTMNYRDKRYWNRRYIGLGDSGGLSASLQCAS